MTIRLAALILLAFALGLAVPSAVADPPVADPVGPLTLDEARALALARSPRLEAAATEVLALEADVEQAGFVPNPELDLRVQNDAPNEGSNDPDSQRLRAILRQELELGGKRRRRVELAESERATAVSERAALEGEIVAAVTSDFAAVLGAERRRAALERHVAFGTAMRERVEGLVATGALGSATVHDVARETGLARIELRQAEAELGAARFRLAAHWGGTTTQFEVRGDLDALPPLPSLEAALELARRSPGVALAEAELARGEARLALARAERVPDFTYGVGVRWDDDAAGQDYLVEVEIDLPVFDRNQGAIGAAQQRLARARAARQAAGAATAAEVAEAYYAAAAADARRAILADEVLPAARGTLRAQEIGFESGAGRLDDLFDARRRLVHAEVDLAEALVDCHQAIAALEATIGGSAATAP